MGCYHNLNYFIQIGDKIGKPIAKTMFCLEIALEHVVDQLSPVCVHTVMLYSAQTVVLCDHLRQKVFEIGFRSCLCQPLLNINRISKVCQELQWRWLLFLCSGVPQFLVGHTKQGDGKGMVRWCWMGKIGKTNMVLVHQSFSSYVKSDVMGCWNGCMHISPTGSFPSSGSTQHLHIVPRSHPKCRRKHLKFLSPQGKLSKKSRMFKVFQGPWTIAQKLHGFPTRKRVQRSRQSHQSCIRSWWTHQHIQQCAAWWPWYCLWREILFQCSLLNSNTLNAKTPWSAAQSQHWTEILQGFIQFSMNMAILVIRFWRVTWLLLPKIRPFFKIQTYPNFPQSLASVLCILWDVESTEWEPELLQVWLRHQGKCWLPTSFRIKAVQDIES